MPRTSSSAIASQMVGQMIKEARVGEELTQDQLAQRLGCSGSYIANVEAGRENLTVGRIASFAEALGRAMVFDLLPVERERIVLPDAESELGFPSAG
jgi:transcriptional regulator with XRE-family HTH domain